MDWYHAGWNSGQREKVVAMLNHKAGDTQNQYGGNE